MLCNGTVVVGTEKVGGFLVIDSLLLAVPGNVEKDILQGDQAAADHKRGQDPAGILRAVPAGPLAVDRDNQNLAVLLLSASDLSYMHSMDAQPVHLSAQGTGIVLAFGLQPHDEGLIIVGCRAIVRIDVCVGRIP